MTWTKISDDFAEQCADLSDAAFRTHVEGLVWSMKRESGGMITKRDVDRLAQKTDPPRGAGGCRHAGGP